MGKFSDGWEQARRAHEAAEAEKKRRLEAMATALKQLSDALTEDGEILKAQNITLKMEHGALVLRRMVEPLAGINFDPESGRFKVHTYASDGSSEMEAADAAECAEKLGEYAFSVKV